jgi:muconate cycloisomerase
VHIAAARAGVLGHDMELFGNVMLEDDLVVDGLAYDGGGVRVPDAPGFGVRLDEAALDRYVTGARVVIER